MELTQPRVDRLALALRIHITALTRGGYGHALTKLEASLKVFEETGLTLRSLGEGCYRTVLSCDEIPGIVVKFEHGGYSNSKEWRVYGEVEGTRHKKRFAVCIARSSDDSVLIMERIEGQSAYKHLGSNSKTAKLQERLERELKELGLYDLHGNNVFFCKRRKRYVIVDYAM